MCVCVCVFVRWVLFTQIAFHASILRALGLIKSANTHKCRRPKLAWSAIYVNTHTHTHETQQLYLFMKGLQLVTPRAIQTPPCGQNAKLPGRWECELTDTALVQTPFREKHVRTKPSPHSCVRVLTSDPEGSPPRVGPRPSLA